MGRTGLKVSRLCLGTMNFGPNTDEKEAFAIMDRALDGGINFFDTANMYGNRNGGYSGWTEEIIGRWFAQGGGRREKVVLTSKVYNDMFDENDGPNGEPGLSAYKIRRHLEGSLRRLQTDHLELYFMHSYDREADWDEIWGVYEALVAQGKVFYAGSSNFGARHLILSQRKAENRNFLGLVCEQHKYNLLCRLPELELLPAAKEMGMGVMTWSPLAMGLLSGNIGKNSDSKQRSKKFEQNLSPQMQKQLRDFSDLCSRIGENEAEVAIAWILSHPSVTAPVIGPRTVDQLERTLRALDIKLDKDISGEIDEIFPGPGGEAPWAYLR